MFKEKFTKGIFYLVVVGVVLGGVLKVGIGHSKLAQAGNTKRMEEYVGRAIIRAGFGVGPGQFGIYEHEQGVSGPTGIAVDNEGYIYIIDNINHRVNKFDKEGRYVSSIDNTRTGDELWVDRKGNVYIRVTPANKVLVRVYDPKGKLVRVYSQYFKYSPENEDTIWYDVEIYNGEGELLGTCPYIRWLGGVWIDREGNAYIVGLDEEEREQLFKITPSGRLEPLLSGRMDISAKGMEDGEERYFSVQQSPDEETVPIKVFDQRGVTKREILVRMPERFVGKYKIWSIADIRIDRYNNIYVLLSLLDKGVPYFWFKDLVMKYNLRGELLAEVELLELPFEEVDLVYGDGFHETVDSEGNVYRMVWSPKRGVEVIKYERKGNKIE